MGVLTGMTCECESEWEHKFSEKRCECEYTGMTWVCGDTVCETSRVSECVRRQVMSE